MKKSILILSSVVLSLSSFSCWATISSDFECKSRDGQRIYITTYTESADSYSGDAKLDVMFFDKKNDTKKIAEGKAQGKFSFQVINSSRTYQIQNNKSQILLKLDSNSNHYWNGELDLSLLKGIKTNGASSILELGCNG